MITIRQINDIDTLMSWRAEVIEHVFAVVPDTDLLHSNRDYYARHIADGSHIAVEALVEGEGIGCGSICLTEELPSPDNPSGRCAYLMNIYVREPYRSHGTGHEIVKFLIQKSIDANCGKIYLETTDDGRPVYRSLGFEDMPDMMKLTGHSIKPLAY